MVALPPQEGRIAILLCAYNEEAVIREKLENCTSLCALDGNASVYVYTDGCSDATVSIVKSFGDRVNLAENTARQGKSVGMNQLVRLARQDEATLLFFTDANVILDNGTLQAVRREFANPEVGCVTGHLDYVNSEESLTAMVGANYWSLDSIIKKLESRTGSCMGADGANFAIRSSLFRAVPDNIIDDFFTSMSVLCDGWRCIYGLEVVARERTTTVANEEYRRKVRISCRAFNCHRLLWPRLARLSAWNLYKYLSHKFLRWLTALWLICAGACFLVGIAGLPLSALMILLVLALLLTVLVALMPTPPWRYVREAVIAIFATGVGVIKSIQGERFQTWSQAATTRQTMVKVKDKG